MSFISHFSQCLQKRGNKWPNVDIIHHQQSALATRTCMFDSLLDNQKQYFCLFMHWYLHVHCPQRQKNWQILSAWQTTTAALLMRS